MSLKFLIVSLVSCSIAIAYSFAVGHDSILFQQIPSFYTVVFGIHLIQILAFVPAKLLNTEVFYDVTGSLTFISAVAFCFYIAKELTTKQIIAGSLLLLWTIRLGGFLFLRILQTKQDTRFAEIKKDTLRFLMTWVIQGLWITLTGGPVYTLLTSKFVKQTGNFQINQIVGLAIWAFGFVVQVTADIQKFLFKMDDRNKDRFIHHGVWRYSRHPNYAGEITLWTGMSIFVSNSLFGWQRLVLICPFFVYILLSKLSGVPPLQKKADKKWGGQPEYEKYKAETPVLFPWSSQKKSKKA